MPGKGKKAGPASSGTIICRCEEVTEEEILKAVEDGARTVTGIKRRTRAGMGLCQGKTCSQLVRSMLARKLSKGVSQIEPDTPRPPSRPLKLSSFLAVPVKK
jgi:NAD(P)H-nitrite reductase large subunit